MILVDSSVWIDYLRARDTAETAMLAQLFTQERLATGDLMLAEVLQGSTSETAFERTRRIMTASLALIPMVDAEVAIQAARNYRLLRARGVTVRKTIDTLIATRCIMEGYPLLFSDRDFVSFVEHLGLIDAMRLPAP
ncbi:MAG TPA: PIN domain nuclease [Sphingomonas sp.]|nr:PIN domain nuclease [Sphingomonas sp.]